MKDKINQKALVNAIHSATEEVFATMLGVPIHAGEPHTGAHDPSSFDGVIALVGLAGSWTGSGRISCGPAFACQLSSAFLMAQFEAVTEEVLDAFGELANMIIGNVKTIMETDLGPLGLSIPTVIFGRNYQARSAGVTEWTVVPFHSGEETLEVRLCLVPNREISLPHRPEVADAVL